MKTLPVAFGGMRLACRPCRPGRIDDAAEGAAASGQASEELTARTEFTTCSSEQKPKINTPLIRLCSVLLWRDRARGGACIGIR